MPSSIDLTAIISLIKSVFSLIVLSAIGVILSGKLMAKRIPINLSSDDHFTINLGILKLRSKGDEVVWGFVMFILAIAVVVIVGGNDAYTYLKIRSGVDIGHWSSLVAIASFFSVLTSTIIWGISPIFHSPPLLNKEERKKQLSKLSENTSVEKGDIK